jgi:hypothetical protein
VAAFRRPATRRPALCTSVSCRGAQPSACYRRAEPRLVVVENCIGPWESGAGPGARCSRPRSAASGAWSPPSTGSGSRFSMRAARVQWSDGRPPIRGRVPALPERARRRARRAS